MEVREYANKDYAALTTVFDSRFFIRKKRMEEITMATAKAKPDLYAPVKLMIPRDPSNPQESDVTITVNGKNFLIKRGVQVEVPQYVAEVYYNSEAQKEIAYARQRRAERNVE